ncbi:hypothetical protein [Amedibacillus sp. YH-ame10]
MLKLKNMWSTLDSKLIENEEDKSPVVLLEKINEVIKQCDLPVDAELDQIKDGLINVKTYDCITLTNREFANRYFKFAIMYNESKKGVLFWGYGESKNLKKLEKRERAKNNVVSGTSGVFSSNSSDFQRGTALNSIVSSAVGGIMSIGGSKKKQNQENEYYDKIYALMQSII